MRRFGSIAAGVALAATACLASPMVAQAAEGDQVPSCVSWQVSSNQKQVSIYNNCYGQAEVVVKVLWRHAYDGCVAVPYRQSVIAKRAIGSFYGIVQCH